MAGVPIRHRQNRNVNLTTFSDELHADVGSAAFILADLKEATGHDYFSGEDFEIWTGAGKTGTQLIVNTHYTLSEENSTYSTLATNAAGSTKTIYLKIQITDATYQSGDLYFSGKYFTDRADSRDMANITVKRITKNTDYTITDLPGYMLIDVTTGATDKTIDYPDPLENIDLEITLRKADSGAGHVIADFDAVGSSTGEGATTATIYSQYDFKTWKSIGTEWILVNKRARTIIWDSAIMAASTIQTNAHGFGIVPPKWDAYLLNVTPDAGYIAGEEVHINTYDQNTSGLGLQVSVDATNLNIIPGSGGSIYLVNKSTYSTVTTLVSKWKIRFKYSG